MTRYQVLDGLSEGYLVVDANLACVYANKAVDKDILASYAARPGVFECLQNCLEQKLPQKIASQFTLSDGSKKWLELYMEPVEEGVLIHAVDIDNYKKIEQALLESEEKYRTLVEYSLEGVMILQNPPLRVVFANPAICKITGYTQDELLSLSAEKIISVIHPDDRHMVFKRLENRLRGKRVPRHYKFRGFKKDGQLIVLQLSSARILYHDQPAVLVSLLLF